LSNRRKIAYFHSLKNIKIDVNMENIRHHVF
jgi:hypothetical protein